MSQPGVEIGIGRPSRPLPGLSSSLPVMTISWHGALVTMRGGSGRAAAATQRASISSNGQFTPMR